MTSYYEDERRRHRPTKQRRDSYDDDSGYSPRDAPRNSGALVKRRDSYDSVDEEVSRDFSPGRGGVIRETTIRKSGTRPARARSYDDDRDYYDDRSYGDSRRSNKYHDDRRDRRSRRYSSEDSSRSRSRTPPRNRERRKSKSAEALEALGLGGLAATLLGKKENDRSRSRSRDGRSGGRARSDDGHGSRRRSKSRGGPSKEQLIQALKAAALAGAGEAFRARKEPGGWTGEKGKRVLTAAVSAGGLDGLISHGKGEDEHKTRNTIGSAIAGIATSRIVNGPRSKSRGRAGSPDSRNGRGRSQSRGIGDLVAAGVAATGAKKAYDSVRGRSSSRGRARSRSASSYDSRSPPRTSRRRSVSRGLAKGLAAVGLTSQADKLDPDRRRTDRRVDDYDDYDDRYDRSGGGRGHGSRGYYDDDDVGYTRSEFPNGTEHARGVARSLSRTTSSSDSDRMHRSGTPSYSFGCEPRHNGDPDTDSDSDLGNSGDEADERKKAKRKSLLTTGLAGVATIHAAHTVYQSYEKRHARQKAVREGKITKDQAKSNRNRDRLQDAASVGLAALGIKGAYSEFKEMKEARGEYKKNMETIERHRAKRAARMRKAEEYREMSAYGGSSQSTPDLHTPQPEYPHPQPFTNPQPGYAPPPNTIYDGHGPYSVGAMQPPGPQYYDDNPYHVQPPPPQTHDPTPMPAPTPPVGMPRPNSNPNISINPNIPQETRRAPILTPTSSPSISPPPDERKARPRSLSRQPSTSRH